MIVKNLAILSHKMSIKREKMYEIEEKDLKNEDNEWDDEEDEDDMDGDNEDKEIEDANGTLKHLMEFRAKHRKSGDAEELLDKAKTNKQELGGSDDEDDDDSDYEFAGGNLSLYDSALDDVDELVTVK